MGAQAVRLTSVDIDNALNNNHFEVIFQPIFNLSNGALLRMEAFVRWVHPGLGVLPPGAFISFFENQGRMNELTRYVLKAALDQYQAWRGNQGPGFSVNLAFSDLTDATFPQWLDETLRENRFPAEHLTLECPNLPANFPAEEASGLFEGLKNTGARLAIEIRGRANDVLKDLQPFPFDEVKTGGSAILRFARTVRGGPGLTAISELLELAQAHDACTVAVGVEDQASLQALVSLGFVAAQGNFLAGVGKADAFQISSINDVRSALSLDPLANDDLFQLMGGRRQPVVEDTVTEPEAAPAEPDEAEVSAAREAAAKEARAKKRKAQLAAKKRAAKKAAALKAAAEKAEAELEEKQRRLKEASARKDAEENARKLQERLTQAYDEPEDSPAATGPATEVAAKADLSDPKETLEPAVAETVPEQPAEEETQETEEDTAPEAGLLLGGSLASAALGRSEPVTGSAKAEQAEEEIAPPDPVEHEAEEATTLQSEEVEATPTETDAPAPETAEPSPDQYTEPAIAQAYSPWAQQLEVKRNTIALEQNAQFNSRSGATDAGVVNPEAEERTARDYHFVFQPSYLKEQEPPAPVQESELMSEDEVLDEVFQETEELDPTALHEEPADDAFELNSTERQIAEKLLRPRKKRKNFLQRKYRITHFWPRSWQRKWRATKARKDMEQDVYEQDSIGIV